MFEKKYKTKNLYFGIIAKQGSTEFLGFDKGYKWEYKNFDVGVFIKKSNGYLRITNNTVYALASFSSENQIVINRKMFHNLAQYSPEFADKFPYLTKKQIAYIEKEAKEGLFDAYNKPAETRVYKEIWKGM